MPSPVGFMFGLILAAFNWTFERGTFVNQISKQFIFEVVGHVLDLEHGTIFAFKLLAANFTNFGASPLLGGLDGFRSGRGDLLLLHGGRGHGSGSVQAGLVGIMCRIKGTVDLRFKT